MPDTAWKDVLIRTWTQAGEDNVSLAAAGVAFYGFTAMVPLLGAIVLIYGLAADAGTVVLPALPQPVLLLGKLLSYAAMVFAGAAGAATLYRYGPDRMKAKWVWITPGSVIAAAIWLLPTIVFGIYVANFGSYDATYGSLGAVIVFLTWLYLTSYVLLLGAELNSEMERQTRVDTTDGPPLPAGERGAAVADDKVTPETRRSVKIAGEPAPSNGHSERPRAPAVAFPRTGLLPGAVATIGLTILQRGRFPLIGATALTASGFLAYRSRLDRGRTEVLEKRGRPTGRPIRPEA